MTEAELAQIARITEKANELIKKIRQLDAALLDKNSDYYVYCTQSKITDDYLWKDCAYAGINALKEKFEMELRNLKLPGQLIEIKK